MNRKKAVWLAALGGVVLLIGLAVGIALLWSWGKTSEHRYYGTNWGIALPASAQLLYEKDNLGWMGDGERYSVFEWDGEDAAFSRQLAAPQKEREEIASFCRSTMNRLQIPLAYRLEPEDSWVYLKVTDEDCPLTDYVYLIYDSSAHRLYLLQTRI